MQRENDSQRLGNAKNKHRERKINKVSGPERERVKEIRYGERDKEIKYTGKLDINIELDRWTDRSESERAVETAAVTVEY